MIYCKCASAESAVNQSSFFSLLFELSGSDATAVRFRYNVRCQIAKWAHITYFLLMRRPCSSLCGNC